MTYCELPFQRNYVEVIYLAFAGLAEPSSSAVSLTGCVDLNCSKSKDVTPSECRTIRPSSLG